MNIVVTGAAGFIGSHLCEELLARGHTVKGIDHMNEPVPGMTIKADNISGALAHPNFEWINADLLDMDLKPLIGWADAVFHLAGIAGVRNSWGSSFADYVHSNILLTQQLLEASKQASNLRKFVYASSSSVYGGDAGALSSEQSALRPISPYGLSKLAGEQLCYLYHKQYGVPYTALRYFTVYGPRQRPDMGFHRFMKAAFLEMPIVIYGNGEQTRDFTYVRDLVEANISAMNYGKHGTVMNVGGTETASVNDVLRRIARISGKTLQIEYIAEQPGDPFATSADISLAQAELGYAPKVLLDEGLANEWSYITKLYAGQDGSKGGGE